MQKKANVLINRHYKMERFGVLFIIFAVAFIILFALGYKAKKENEKLNLGSQALYTKAATWSITGQEIQITNIYRNDNSTKLFFALKMPDVSNFSTNSNDYRVFILSEDETGKLYHDITGSYYIFGNTGYMGIMLNDSKGFEQGLAHVVIRNQARISSTPGQFGTIDDAKDSFENFNQVEILANLAGTDAVVADSLNADSLDIGDLYAECIISSEYSGYKNVLSEDIASFNAKLSVMYEYKRRLETWGFDVPFPSCLNGDYVTTDSASTSANPIAFDTSMLNSSSNVISTIYNEFDSNGNTDIQYYKAGDDIYLVTNFVFPGGCQYDYQNVKSTDHFLDSFLPSGENYYDWRSAKKNESAEYASQSWFTVGTWVLNGREYDKEDGSLSNDVRNSYNDAITNYVTNVNELITLKKKYQVEDLYTLLDFENSVRSIDSVTSINNTADAIFVVK